MKIQEKILKILSDSKKALSAQEIHALLCEYDLASIYRNLKKLVNSGDVKELVQKKECLYEVNKDNHHHAICQECGKIFHIKLPQKLIKAVKVRNFDIENVDITIRGQCAEHKY